ncbi:MAG: ArsA-related P-loop ATPase [Candidatus Methanosuratincola sp.]|jgi:anion-transporting  ArsA/GET3 family ATPase
METVSELLHTKEIIICLGSGGAGKTTVAAGIALEGACRGRSTIAITVDPAKRLASAMGLKERGGERARIDEGRLLEAGLSPKGSLDVMLLDVRATFDSLVCRLAPTASARDKILSNSYYRTIADSLSGSHEYMAMEALLTVYEERRHGLIVVDTPPSRHFLDFLSAPRRLIELLDTPQLRWLARGGNIINRITLGITRAWSNIALGAVERVVGVDVLRDIWNFFLDIECINAPLRKRAEKVFEVLRSPGTAFLIVSKPDESSLEDAASLYEKLKDEGYPVSGVIVNRLYSALGELGSNGGASLAELEGLGRKVLSCCTDFKRLRASQVECLKRLESVISKDSLIVSLPELDDEVYDLSGLVRIKEHIFGC